MVRIARILRDYSDAGGVNTLLPLWGFVDGETFLTKAGHVGLVYSLRGVDVDGLTQAQRRALTHRMEAALRQLDERCRVYQYLVKRTVDPFVAPLCAEPVAQEALNRRTAYLNDRRPELYQLAQYVVLLRESANARSGEHAAPGNLARAPRGVPPVALDPSFAEAAGGRARRRHRTGSFTKPSHSSLSWPTSGWHGSHVVKPSSSSGSW